MLREFDGKYHEPISDAMSKEATNPSVHHFDLVHVVASSAFTRAL